LSRAGIRPFLNAAIADAEAVSQDPLASQARKDAALSELTTAAGTFAAAKQPGTKAGASPETDKGALNTTIGAANAAKTGVVVSADGNEVPQDVYWAA
jgi:hypothetical protein